VSEERLPDTKGTPLPDDYVQPFSVEGTDVRGQVVQLGPSLNAMLGQHTYPEPVLHLLGEFTVLAAMMGSTIKFDGKLTVQAQGSGPVRLVVVDYASDGAIRCYAQVADETVDNVGAVPSDAPDRADPAALGTLLGKGHMAITIDQGPDMERYQGIVEIGGTNVIDAALTYFAQSEQTLTAIRIGVGKAYQSPPDGGTAQAVWRGGGIMIQRLPQAGYLFADPTHESLDDWERLSVLMETTQADELIDRRIGSERLLTRLYHRERVRVFEPKPVRFSCTCSIERTENMLKSLGYATVQDLMEEGRIEVRCEFCNEVYRFNQVDLLKIGLGPSSLS